ncbi:MAG: twin-arginine translocation pathway signal protein [Betaproteobacteria bacterium HGW-Betaproteobacteria-13]|jgi:thiol:disulfide interchange protein DsbA|nr:MAG: twin-arginine translocation pathway signal protein [Betaproteobacteria bacterium HGW-Betaproteobacteria-13]
MNRRHALQQLGAFALLASPAAAVLAQSGSGQGYQVLEPAVPTATKGKIEVIEFFHYGCPHCRDFDPLLEQWKKRLPADISFVRVPAIWGNPQLQALARLYYTFEVTGQVDALHEPVFGAVQDDREPLNTEDGVRAWVGKRGIDTAKFMEAYKSFGVESLVKRADQIARAYKVQGVPTMAVDGRFITSASLTGSHEGTLKQVDSLLARVRSEARKG